MPTFKMENRELKNLAIAHEDNGDSVSESSHGRDGSRSPPARTRATGETARAQVRVKVCVLLSFNLVVLMRKERPAANIEEIETL